MNRDLCLRGIERGKSHASKSPVTLTVQRLCYCEHGETDSRDPWRITSPLNSVRVPTSPYKVSERNATSCQHLTYRNTIIFYISSLLRRTCKSSFIDKSEWEQGPRTTSRAVPVTQPRSRRCSQQIRWGIFWHFDRAQVFGISGCGNGVSYMRCIAINVSKVALMNFDALLREHQSRPGLRGIPHI